MTWGSEAPLLLLRDPCGGAGPRKTVIPPQLHGGIRHVNLRQNPPPTEPTSIHQFVVTRPFLCSPLRVFRGKPKGGFYDEMGYKGNHVLATLRTGAAQPNIKGGEEGNLSRSFIQTE